MRTRKIIKTKTSIEVNQSIEGETIEQKINRITVNKEPIEDTAPIIYTDRRDGVRPEFDIRTDRFELAIEAMDKVTASHLGKREDYLRGKDVKDEKGNDGDVGTAESIQATE